jgi:hypothetical protein
MVREEYRQRLAQEYRYAATKMQESSQSARKLYYFSVLFGESQRILNWEWDRDLSLIYMAGQYTYNQINLLMQPGMHGNIPIDDSVVFTALTQAIFDLATYLEKTEDNTEELHQILGRFAEISYAVTGNGSYLYEKGLIRF